MRVLILFQRRRTHRYLINLFTQSLISEVRSLIGNQEYAKAMDLVYDKGLLEREVLAEEIPAIRTDLILSDRYANWDIKR